MSDDKLGPSRWYRVVGESTARAYFDEIYENNNVKDICRFARHMEGPHKTFDTLEARLALLQAATNSTTVEPSGVPDGTYGNGY